MDKQLVITRTPGGLSISGVVDNYNIDSFSRSLSALLDGNGDVDVDPHGRRLVLHGLPQKLRTVMMLVGWTDMPGLVIAEVGVDE